jgi:CubicO group peptidase (beta-lactamase class C family)
VSVGDGANLSRAEMLSAWEDPLPVTDQRTRAVVSALSRPPRSRGAFRYSNLGYIVVGAAIDRIAGIPFGDVLRTASFRGHVGCRTSRVSCYLPIGIR